MNVGIDVMVKILSFLEMKEQLLARRVSKVIESRVNRHPELLQHVDLGYFNDRKRNDQRIQNILTLAEFRLRTLRVWWSTFLHMDMSHLRSNIHTLYLLGHVESLEPGAFLLLQRSKSIQPRIHFESCLCQIEFHRSWLHDWNEIHSCDLVIVSSIGCRTARKCEKCGCDDRWIHKCQCCGQIICSKCVPSPVNKQKDDVSSCLCGGCMSRRQTNLLNRKFGTKT